MQQLWPPPSCTAAMGEEATCLMREHATGGARSTLALPWFCEELGAKDDCRGHLLFYPSVGM